HMLRFRLTSFAPSEEEFRFIFQKQLALDQQLGASQTPENMARRAAAERALTQEIKAALGPERGAEYERGTDYHYRLTSQLAHRLELPPTTAPQAWKLQMDFMGRAAKLRTDSQLSPEQRTAQSAALFQEATAQLTSLFGGEQ